MPTTSINELNQRLGLPGIAEVVQETEACPKSTSVCLPRRETSTSTVCMVLHGGRTELMMPCYLSFASKWEEGKAIRGGVPISFPWFADKANDSKAPAHGFVRT